MRLQLVDCENWLEIMAHDRTRQRHAAVGTASTALGVDELVVRSPQDEPLRM